MKFFCTLVVLALVVSVRAQSCQPYYGGICNPTLGTSACCTGRTPSVCIRHSHSNQCQNNSGFTEYRCTTEGATSSVNFLGGTASSFSSEATGNSTLNTGEARISINGNIFNVSTYFCFTNGAIDYSCSGSDKTLKFAGGYDGEIQCLDWDAGARRVWLSGRITHATNDARLSPEASAALVALYNSGRGVAFASFQDTNGDGLADIRSLFLDGPDGAVAAYPNPTGTIASPPYITQQGDLNPRTLCLRRGEPYVSADYRVVDGATNLVQFLDPTDSFPIGSQVTGTASNISNPPSGAIYDLSPATITRVLQGQLHLKFGI